MSQSFGTLLREHRLRMGIGLREFAEMIPIKASNLSGLENDSRPPIRDLEKLRHIAELLGLKEHSADWQTFVNSARKPRSIPADLTEFPMQSGVVLSLLRTIDRHQPSESELEDICRRIQLQLEGKTDGNVESR